MLFGKRQERSPLQAKCRKGKPCGAICIPKGSSCREGKRTGDNEVTRYNQEYIASLFTQSVNPWTGQPDFQKFRSLPRVEQQKALKSAYRWLEDAKVEKKTRKDASAGADGKCGPGWKPGPGGRCVRGARAGTKEALKRYLLGAGTARYNNLRQQGTGRLASVRAGTKEALKQYLLGKAGTARYNNLRQQGTGRLASVGVKSGLRALGMTAATGYVAADQASYAIARKKSADANRQRKVDRIAKKVEQRAYDKNFESRMAESFDPKVADFQGKKAAMEAREKFERRAKVKANADSLGLSRLDGSRKNNKDSLMDDYYSEIAQIIEYSQGIRVDSIYGLEDQGSSLVGIASSGGDFFEFEIDSRSTGVAPRPDLTHSANERARGALSAMGISYRGDSAYEFLCGMEFREDNLGQSAKAAIGRVKSAVMGGVNRVKQAFGSKPATPAPASGGKRRMLKRAAKIGAGLAVAGGGVAAYKNRDKIKAAAPGISSAAQGAARDVGRSINQGVNAAKRKVAAAQVARTKFADPKDVNPF